MRIFVGLDCGGSSSRVWAVNEAGESIFQGSSGAANLTSTPELRIRRNLATAAQGCPAPDAVCGCFAGLIDPSTREKGFQLVRELFPSAAVRVEPDYTAALHASSPETTVCVIAGTGSLVCSRTGDQVVKSGGRGYLLGDEGSAFRYGRDALNHYLDDPKKASKALRQQVEHVFGEADEPQILGAVYGSLATAALVARFAKPLGKDAMDGQLYALQSIQRNTSAFVQVIQRHMMRFHAESENWNVCLAGGVWKIAPCFKLELERQLEAAVPNRKWNVYRTVNPPVYGAVQLAKEMMIGN